jgi:hypothetical protein
MTAPRESTRPPEEPQEVLPKWGRLEVFVLIQYLSTALLFLPGAQAFRFAIRTLPYASSLGLLLLECFKSPAGRSRPTLERRPWKVGNGLANDADKVKKPLPPSQKWLTAVLVLLVLGLAHPLTEFPSGPAQIVFQLCIAAPIFWVWKKIESVPHLNRLIWLMFIANALSVLVGLLQVYYPDQFMPPEFSRVALALNASRIEQLSYIGADGRMIIRPPGLSDMPGGVAVAGMTVGFLGIVLASQQKIKLRRRLLLLAASAAGVFILYLTQVRSLMMMMLVAVVAMCALLWVQKRMAQLLAVAVVSAGLVIGAFTWAVSVGGKSVADRFLGIAEEGAVTSFQKNRGAFVMQTIEHLLPAYPLGAGVGRWGMMKVYFPSKDPAREAAPWVEVQLTGWLLDGGVLMWVLYGGAILIAIFASYRVVVRRPDPELSYLAGLLFCLELFIVGQSFAGPVFNTQLGIQFWFIVAALHGVSCRIPLPVQESTANKVPRWPQLKPSRSVPAAKRQPKTPDRPCSEAGLPDGEEAPG